MSYFYIDIETIPTQHEELRRQVKGKVKAPSNYKDKDKIADYILAHTREALDKTALHPMGEIVCIGCAVDDHPTITFVRQDSDYLSEMKLLQDWLDWLTDLNEPGRPYTATIVGHNVIGFDIPRIWQRCKVYDLMIPSWWPMPWQVSRWRPYNVVLDTMYAFSPDPLISLETLALMLGIRSTYPVMDFEGETRPVTGADIYQLWLDGQDNTIAEYCKEDVEVTRMIAKRLK